MASVAAISVVGGASMISTSPVVAATAVDLTTLDASAVVDGATLRQSNFDSSTGTGVFESFVRVQASGTEEGFNTSGAKYWDELSSPNFTRDLPLNAVPIVQDNGATYREFRLDINEVDSNPIDAKLSLDRVRLFVGDKSGAQIDAFLASVPAASPDPDAADFGVGANLVWDLDAGSDRTVTLNYSLAPGSGNGDMVLLVPEARFGDTTGCAYAPTGPPCGKYVYLWSSFGEEFTSSDGFEEWSVRKVGLVAASKTANPTWTRTYDWTITKLADPDEHDLFAGESDTSDYDIELGRSYQDSGFAVTGEIRFSNPADKGKVHINPSTIVDTISFGNTTIGAPTISTCGGETGYVEVNAGETVTCPYSFAFPSAPVPGLYYTNTATIPYYEKDKNEFVEIDGSPIVAVQEFQFTLDNATIVGPPMVNVTDTYQGGESDEDVDGYGPFDGSASPDIEYPREFACSSDPADYSDGTYTYSKTNTAVIDETGDSSTEFVEVRCYAPVVTKSADTSYLRTYDWTITKDVTPPSHELFIGGSGTSAYDVSVARTQQDSGWTVFGDIGVENPHPTDAMDVAVSDTVDGQPATIGTCTVPDGDDPDSDADVVSTNLDGTRTVPAGTTMTCTYTAALAGAVDGTNVATVEFNGIVFTSGPVDYQFGEPSIDPDGEPATIDVTDTFDGGEPDDLGEATDSTDFDTYQRDFTCSSDTSLYVGDGTYTFTKDNTAKISQTDDEDSETVTVNCYAPVVSKTADTRFDRTYSWTIVKSGKPLEHSLFAGESASTDYEVTVTKTTTDSNFEVYGTIGVLNPHPESSMNVAVADSIGDLDAVVGTCTVPGDPNPVPVAQNPDGTHTVPAATTMTCDYVVGFDTRPTLDEGTNTATVTFGQFVFEATDGYDWSDATITTFGSDTVNVTDSVAGALGTTNQTKTFEYPSNFECSADIDDYTDGTYTETYPNTATIIETEQDSNTVDVQLSCFIPLVEKTATPTFTRDWDWSIEKSADATDLTLALGQVYTVNYDVTVSAVHEDSAWNLAGDVRVTNPNDEDPMTVAITDTITPGGLDVVVAGCTVPDGDDAGSDPDPIVHNLDGTWVVPAGATATCTYSYDFPIDPGDGTYTNTATATLNTATDDADVAVDSTGVQAAFTAPTTVLDECIDVSDTFVGGAPVALGQVCASGLTDGSFTFSYSRDISVSACGDTSFPNTASFSGDADATDTTADWVVDVFAPCECTLTQGYWKTHSEYGPAPYDDTWAMLPNGADTTFFLSGQSYYAVLWTAPQGNAYYNLAHQYIAAQLNGLNGAAKPPDVQSAFDAATTLLNTYMPSQVATMKGKNGNNVRSQFIAAAGVLDGWNNGPSHCDESPIG